MPERIRRAAARLVITAAVLAAAGLSCAGRTTASSPTAQSLPSAGEAASPLLPRSDLRGLPNFAKVSDALYRGAQPTTEGFAQLRRMGIKTVVNFRSLHDDRPMLRGTGLRYVHIPAHPWHPEDEDMAAFLKIVRDPANQPVFIHCEHGADRTGCAAAVYRMMEQHWPGAGAAAELPRFGFHAIWGQVPAYLARLQTTPARYEARGGPPPKVEVVE